MAQILPPDYQEFENGKIPACALVSITGGGKLHPEAAAQFEKLLAAAKRANRPFTLTSAYRNYATQETAARAYANQPGRAARPGTSNHGWGVAIDITELYDQIKPAKVALNLPSDPEQNNTTPQVNAWIRSNSELYKWLDANAPAFGWENTLKTGNVQEAWHWEYVGFNNPNISHITISEECADSPEEEGTVDTSELLGSGVAIYGYPVGSNGQKGISPYIGSTDSLHPKIQFELSRRRMSEETANTHMPFVKLTSLSNVLPDNLNGITTAYCPTLGIHGEPRVSFDDIYHPQSNNSIVGYATTEKGDGTISRVPLLVNNPALTDAPNIPMPGIVGVSTDRSTAGPMGVRGGLFRVNMKIVAYSVGQLDALMRYFLRPATRVVLELGRKSTSVTEQPITVFDWNRPKAKILDELDSLVTLNIPKEENESINPQFDFINKYTYDNFGNYEIFVAYVVTNKIKYSKNNTYEIELTLHSVQQFEVPVKTTGATPICKQSISDKCKVTEIADYFTPNALGQNSFDKVLAKAIDGREDLGKIWSKHVIKLIDKGADSTTTEVKSPGYLISWKFFLDVILHDETYGIMSIFSGENNTDAKNFIKKSLPPLVTERYSPTTGGLYSNEVSYHKFLRSTNPGVMVIINPSAQTKGEANFDQSLTTYRTVLNSNKGIVERATRAAVEFLGISLSQRLTTDASGQKITSEDIEKDSITAAISAASAQNQVGIFTPLPDTTVPAASLLRGVLINSNAIREAFSTADTVTNALSRLLTVMNNSVEQFWNLQLYSTEFGNPGIHVVDMGLSKPVESELLPAFRDIIPTFTDTQNSRPNIAPFIASDTDATKPKYLYLFNRKLSIQDNKFTGSELLDINLELALPQVIAVQAIAGVGGVAQRGTLEAIDIDELTKITLFPELYAPCGVTPCGDTADPKNGECIGDYSLYADPTYGISEADLQTIAKLFTDENYDADKVREERNKLIEKVRESAQTYGRELGRVGTSIRGEREKAGISAVDKFINALINEYEQRNFAFISLIRQYTKSFGNAIRFIEYDKTAMVKEIDDDRDSPERNGVHPFNSSNLTKTVVDLTMPGIGGIQLFQAFAVDRVPNILDSGYYVVTKVSHEFSINNGWITKIQGRFRAKPRRPATLDANPCPEFRGSVGTF
jgi:hypothetical protein